MKFINYLFLGSFFETSCNNSVFWKWLFYGEDTLAVGTWYLFTYIFGNFCPL